MEAPTIASGGDTGTRQDANTRRPLIVLVQTGSHGDIQPFCLMGCALVAAGHRVKFATEARWKPLVQSHGLDFRLIAGDSMGHLDDEHASKRMYGHSLAAQVHVMKEWKYRSASAKEVLSSYEVALRGAGVIVTGLFCCFEAISVAESTGAVLVGANLVPWSAFTTDYPMAMVAKMLLRCRCSRFLNRLSWYLLYSEAWRDQAQVINAWRVESLGIPPCRHPRGPLGDVLELSSPNVIPQLLLGTRLLCIDGRPASDWSPTTQIVGPFIAPPEPLESIPAGIRAFVECCEDERPVACIGFGSMTHPHPESFVSLIVDACTMAGVRAVLLTGSTDVSSKECQGVLTPAVTSKTLVLTRRAPHGWLFSRVAVVVHHGGVGTASAAFASGVPQVRHSS